MPKADRVTRVGVLLAALAMVVVLTSAPVSGCASPATPPGPSDTSLAALVRLIPDDPAARAGVVVNDEVRAAAAYGADRAQLVARAGLDPAPIAGAGADGARWRQEVGFSFDFVDGDVRLANAPPAIQVLVGRFGGVGRAVRADPAWRSLRTHHSFRGYGYDAWLGDGAFDPARSTPVRPLGQAARVAVRGDRLTWTDTTAALQDAVHAQSGHGRLGDVPSAAALARAADDLGLYAAFLAITPSFRRGVEPGLASASAVAIGEGRDNSGPFLGVVLIEADQLAAQDNAARFRRVLSHDHSVESGRPWQEVFPVAQVSSSGVVVTARLRTKDVQLWSALVASGDSLLAGVSQ